VKKNSIQDQSIAALKKILREKKIKKIFNLLRFNSSQLCCGEIHLFLIVILISSLAFRVVSFAEKNIRSGKTVELKFSHS